MNRRSFFNGRFERCQEKKFFTVHDIKCQYNFEFIQFQQTFTLCNHPDGENPADDLFKILKLQTLSADVIRQKIPLKFQ